MVAPPSSRPPRRDSIEVGDGQASSVHSPKAMNSVVVALDGSSFGESALGHARAVAAVYDSHLHLVHVLDPRRTGGTAAASAECRLQRIEANSYLERQAGALDAQGIEASVETREGTPEHEIVAAAFEQDADLVVLASRPRLPDARLVSRGVAHAVIATGDRSLLVARGEPARRGRGGTSYRRIAVAVDGSRASHGAMRVAEALARGVEAPLVLVHVLDPGVRGSFGREEATAYLRELAGKLGDSIATTETLLRRSALVAETLEEAAGETEADLLELGARGWGGSGSRYGHCARRLLLHGKTSLLVVRDAGERRVPDGPRIAGKRRPRRHVRRRTTRGKSREEARGLDASRRHRNG